MGNEDRGLKIKKKEVSLLGLFGKDSLEELQKRLSAVTDFSFSIIDYKGNEVTSSLMRHRFCDYMKKDGSCQGCKMQTALAAAKAAIINAPHLYECENGLMNVAIPIIVNEQYLGAVICGQIRCKDKESLDAASYERHSDGDNNRELSVHYNSYKDIPEFDFQRIKAVSELVYDYLKVMCEREAYSLAVYDFSHKEVHLKDLRVKIATLTDQVKKMDSKALRATLLPQTLLNMLVTVSNYAILEDAKQTEDIIQGFSSILRYYTELGHERITLANEIREVVAYMDIIAGQYCNRLKCRIHQQPMAEKQFIPKLTVLPLVEYMVNFGILNNNFKGTFYLDTTFSMDRCIVSLQFEHTENAVNHMGFLKQSGEIITEVMVNEQMANLKKRLEYMFGNQYSLKVRPDLITLEVPITSEAEGVTR